LAPKAGGPEPAPAGSKRQEWRRFGLAALVVLAAGSWLPQVADGLATALGLSRSFVGTVLMALVTTLPEMAVTLGALRLGAWAAEISRFHIFDQTSSAWRRFSPRTVHIGSAVAVGHL
jgi:hypothetical protein